MRLPNHVKVEDPVWHSYGLRYERPDGTSLFADMNGGWTPEELEAIAADIRERVAKRPRKTESKPTPPTPTRWPKLRRFLCLDAP